MGLKEKFKSKARETAEKITDGKLPAQHLGAQSYETINQEIYSLRNTKPAFRNKKWTERFETVKKSENPKGIITSLDLMRPIYRQTAAYGHFGRTDLDLPWEKLDKVKELKKYL